MEVDANHWCAIRESLFSEFVKKDYFQPDGRNVIFHLKNGRKLAAHESVLFQASNVFHRIAREKDPFGNYDIVLPEVQFATMKTVLEIIYNGSAIVQKDQELWNVSWVLENTFGLKDTDFTSDITEGVFDGEDLAFLDDVDDDKLIDSIDALDSAYQNLDYKYGAEDGVNDDVEDINGVRDVVDTNLIKDYPQDSSDEDGKVVTNFDLPLKNKDWCAVGSLTVGRTFESWENCKRAIKRTCLKENVKVVLSRIYKRKELSSDNIQQFPYFSATYKCKKHRSSKRGNPSCPFVITVKYLTIKKKMFISKIVNIHKGHWDVKEDSTASAREIAEEEDFKRVDYNGRLVEGATFDTYREFLRIFQKYCYEKSIYYTTKSSEKTDPSSGCDLEKVPFHNRWFVCRHFGPPRMTRSKGIRATSSYGTGCKFELRLSYYTKRGKYVITKVHLDHKGHELKPEFYANHGKVKKPFALSEFPSMNDKQESSPHDAEQFVQRINQNRVKEMVIPKIVEKLSLGNAGDDFAQTRYEGRLVKGETFETYKEFLKVFQKYCYERTVYYTIQRSKRTDPGTELDLENNPIQNCCFTCKYFGLPKKSKSLGIRSPHTTKTGCTFFVSIKYKARSKRYKIEDACLDHFGHRFEARYVKKHGQRVRASFNLSEFPVMNALQKGGPFVERKVVKSRVRMVGSKENDVNRDLQNGVAEDEVKLEDLSCDDQNYIAHDAVAFTDPSPPLEGVDFDDVVYEGRVAVGQTFQSYKEFLRIFQKYCFKKVIYYVTVNSMKRDQKSCTDERRFPWSRIKFACLHHRDVRGEKTRKDSTPRIECPFFLYLCFQKQEQIYVIKSLCLDHGHQLVPEYLDKGKFKVQKPFRLSEFPSINPIQKDWPGKKRLVNGDAEPKMFVDDEMDTDGEEVDEEIVVDRLSTVDKASFQRLQKLGKFSSQVEFCQIFDSYCRHLGFSYRTKQSDRQHPDDYSANFPLKRFEVACSSNLECSFFIKLMHSKPQNCLTIVDINLAHLGHAVLDQDPIQVVQQALEMIDGSTDHVQQRQISFNNF